MKGKGNEKGKGAAAKEKENGKARAKERSVNYLLRQDSPLPPPVPRKGKPKVQIRKAKDFPNAPMGEFVCRVKKHPPPPPRLPDRTGAGVRAAEAAASGSATCSKLPHASTDTEVLQDEEKEDDDEDGDMEEDKEKDDQEYDKQNLFVVPPLQGGADMSDDDTSDGYKESADELEGDTMSEESLVHVVSSEDSEEEARERKKKKNKRPRANAPVRTKSDVWAHFHKEKEPSVKNPGQSVLKACCNYCENRYAYEQGGSTSTIGRHHTKCLNYKAMMARAAIQTTLELRKTNGTTSVPMMSPSIEYDQGIIKELIAKMICVHEYSFRMVEHEWFNILMKCMNPNYKCIGRKAIRADTRWSSTYKMISTARQYKEALTSHAGSNANYAWAPTNAEWDMYDLISPLLGSLAEVTKAFSGSLYPTSNIFYPYIVGVKIAIRNAIASDSEHYKQMGEEMLDKFEKYWEEKNNAMVIATIFDPRYKMNYIEWAFGELYVKGSTRFTTEIKVVEKELEALYDKCVAQDKRARNGASSSSSTTIPCIPVQAGYESFLSARSTTISKSELRNYLEDEVVPPSKSLDLLAWWKVNAPRYPIMAKIAKRFLTILATSVSSESTFSTSGRILDDYRSSLKPVMVEALVCGASYIKGAHADLNIVPRDEDEEDDVETIILPVVEEIND